MKCLKSVFIIKVTTFDASHCNRKICHFCAEQGIKEVVLCVAPGEWRDTLSLARSYEKLGYLAVKAENSAVSGTVFSSGCHIKWVKRDLISPQERGRWRIVSRLSGREADPGWFLPCQQTNGGTFAIFAKKFHLQPYFINVVEKSEIIQPVARRVCSFFLSLRLNLLEYLKW